jgi:putative FmdB family regulatory protein
MPLYEYQCEKCGSLFEVIQKFADAPLEVHENCGGAVKRLLSAPGLQFKGSGWYITDYARGGSQRKSGGDGESKPAGKTGETKGGGETNSDSKPAPASTTKSE